MTDLIELRHKYPITPSEDVVQRCLECGHKRGSHAKTSPGGDVRYRAYCGAKDDVSLAEHKRLGHGGAWASKCKCPQFRAAHLESKEV